MAKPIKAALAGAGAFGLKHLDAIEEIDGVEVISLVGRELDKTKEAAAKYGVGPTTKLADTLKLPGLDAIILATPTQMHGAQTIQCLDAGKHVQVEIPLADLAGQARFGPDVEWVETIGYDVDPRGLIPSTPRFGLIGLAFRTTPYSRPTRASARRLPDPAGHRPIS